MRSRPPRRAELDEAAGGGGAAGAAGEHKDSAGRGPASPPAPRWRQPPVPAPAVRGPTGARRTPPPPMAAQSVCRRLTPLLLLGGAGAEQVPSSRPHRAALYSTAAHRAGRSPGARRGARDRRSPAELVEDRGAGHSPAMGAGVGTGPRLFAFLLGEERCEETR